MAEQKPCCDAAAAKMVKRLTLRDGLQVGILDLDKILQEVAELKLVDAKTVKEALLKRAKAHNYVASGAETEYSTALFQEYMCQFEKPK